MVTDPEHASHSAAPAAALRAETWGGEGAGGPSGASERRSSLRRSPSRCPWPRTCIPPRLPAASILRSLTPPKASAQNYSDRQFETSRPLACLIRSHLLFKMNSPIDIQCSNVLFSLLTQTFCFLVNCLFFQITLPLSILQFLLL